MGSIENLLLAAVGVLFSLILVTLWAVVYQAVKQQGRILMRLDDVETRLDDVEHQLAHARQDACAPTSVGPNGGWTKPQGAAAGTVFSAFRLPDLAGHMVGLEDFRSKRVLLVHWSSQCPFCDLIAPHLAILQAELRRRHVQLLLASYGDADANRRLAETHGLTCPILLQDQLQPLEVFQGLGTPAAYLLDEQRRVGKPVAVGANEVLVLAQQAASGQRRLGTERSLGESRIEREGLKGGTLAPVFSLPDIHGEIISLKDYRGRRLLLVFTDPECGPCDVLAPHLVRLHQEHHDDGLSLVMVARGQAEENRRKAKEHDFKFPVVLQDGWRLSRRYGIFATPVAFLLNEEGVVATDVAKGPDAILALAREALQAKR